MQLRGLTVAAVLLAILAGGVWWSNKTKKADEGKPPADASPKLTSFQEGDLKKIEVKRATGETTVLERDGSGTWRMTSPAGLPVDKDSATSLASSAASIASDSLVEEKATDFAPFGLASPSMEIAVTKKDGATTKVLLGDDTPTSSGVYARIAGDPRVFTLASYAKTSLDKTSKDLRDKRLLTFDSDKLSRVELSAKKTVTEFGKNNQNEWTIVKPEPYRADGWAVEELIRKLKEAKLDPNQSDEDAKKAAAAFASGTLVATAKMTDAGGTQTLEVHKSKDNKYYAKSSAVTGIFSVPDDTGTGLDKATDDFRNKKLFDFGFSEPTKVDYKDASRTLALSKSGEKWTNANKLVDSIGVQSLIDKLRDLSASKFGTTGFTTPVIEVTVVSNDGKRTEKVGIAKVGSDYLARREGEPALYQIDPKPVEDLQKAAGDVKEPPPPNPAKK